MDMVASVAYGISCWGMSLNESYLMQAMLQNDATRMDMFFQQLGLFHSMASTGLYRLVHRDTIRETCWNSMDRNFSPFFNCLR